MHNIDLTLLLDCFALTPWGILEKISLGSGVKMGWGIIGNTIKMGQHKNSDKSYSQADSHH